MLLVVIPFAPTVLDSISHTRSRLCYSSSQMVNPSRADSKLVRSAANSNSRFISKSAPKRSQKDNTLPVVTILLLCYMLLLVSLD